jgi:hypothetical protein
MLSTLGPHMAMNHTYLTWSTYSNISRNRQQSWAGPLLPRKRAPDIIHSIPADRSADPYPVSLSGQPIKQWGQSQAYVDGRLVGLLGPYHQHAFGAFNTCSWGSTHRSLTNTGGGYNLEGVGFLHITPRPFQPTVLTFHLRVLLGLRLSIQQLPIELKWTKP